MNAFIQNTVLPTDLPGFPWEPGNKVLLYAVPLNNAFISLQEQITSLAGTVDLISFAGSGSAVAGTSITLNWGGDSLVAAGPYVITATAAYQFTIVSADVYVGSTGGSFVATVLIDGVPIDGLAGITISDGFKKRINAVGLNNTVVTGSELDVVISDVLGNPVNGYICLNGAPATTIPVFGFAVGNATGVATVQAVSANQALARGIATGAANVAAGGGFIVPDQSLATAAGLGVAIGVGFATSALPILALDDPNEAGLDFNPLG